MVVVNTDLTISTEKLVELFAIVRDDNINMDDIAGGFGLPLPSSKKADIRRNYHNPAQRRDAYLDLYATDHPCLSWSDVARVLRDFGFRHQADEVERTYVQGTVIYSPVILHMYMYQVVAMVMWVVVVKECVFGGDSVYKDICVKLCVCSTYPQIYLLNF